MGAYLSEPVTEKVSSDNESERVRYGASSMQGWRVSQEDAHNCIIEYDKNTSLFAVYDGHGGHEVAAYCSQKLPQFIKDTEAYKNGNLKDALINAFLGFDATIATREIVAVLKEIAGVKDNENADELASDDEENVSNLYEEASMPIEQVMEKYQSNLLHPSLKKLQGDKCPVSPMLKARKCEESECSSSGASSSKTETFTENISTSNDSSKTDSSETSEEIPSKSNISLTDSDETSEENVKKDLNVVSSASSDCCSDPVVSTTTNCESKTEQYTPIETTEIKPKPESTTAEESDFKTEDSKKSIANGETTKENEDKSNLQANGEVVSPKGKGKAKSPKKEVPVKNLRARNTRQLYSKLLELQEESESEDESDVTFEGTPNYSSDSGDESSEPDDDENDENDCDEEYEEDMYDEDDNEFTRNMTEEPGSDSGCTAVVALLHGNELYVANAGDSRCIVCRNGQAVEMSFDHKPEDEPEMARVIKAGGKVTQDGRVNGGLNLSRAIGDHAYKQNKELSDKEQMITALPDIKTLTVNPAEDEFMVLACDGIWNFMSSQEVVDFVRTRLNEKTGPEKLSQICEEMFEHCLAPHTMGDGTGCDNMTAIIVQFRSGLMKRGASPDCSEESSAKRVKTETT